VRQEKLPWQSKLILLLVLPLAATSMTLDCIAWWGEPQAIVLSTLVPSVLLGLLTWKVRAATPAAAVTGAVITASLMLSTTTFPYSPWHTAFAPTLGVGVLAFLSTRVGRRKKERLGTAEARRGRSASQIAANLGVAALIAIGPVQSWLLDMRWPLHAAGSGVSLLVMAIAALGEAAADTVSSEIGQVLGGRPRMITTLRAVEPGQDGAVSIVGTLAGIVAACLIAAVGTWALRGDWSFFALSAAGAVFGLFFDSLLGATFEAWGWINNDAVNFLSTASAAGFALGLVALVK